MVPVCPGMVQNEGRKSKPLNPKKSKGVGGMTQRQPQGIFLWMSGWKSDCEGVVLTLYPLILCQGPRS